MPGADGGHELIGTDLADIRDVVETNYFGALRVARAFAPIPAGNGGGALVGIHSVLSWVAGWGAYGCSKPALWSATNSANRAGVAGNAGDRRAPWPHRHRHGERHCRAEEQPHRRGETDPRRHRKRAIEILADDTTRQFKSALSVSVIAKRPPGRES
jgi:NAD(P)-dependent dehydrogenase (short-subunit alcohol dehydrogenase family)